MNIHMVFFSQMSHDYPYYWFTSDPKSKQDKDKIANFRKLAKIHSFKFCKKRHTQHTFSTRLIISKKNEMDPTRTVGATERTRDAGRTDGRSETNTLQLRFAGGIIVIKTRYIFKWTDNDSDRLWTVVSKLYSICLAYFFRNRHDTFFCINCNHIPWWFDCRIGWT